MTQNKTVAIVVGGGPAPGINGVISAVTIEAIKNNYRVLGIMEGFKWLSKGDVGHVKTLQLDDVTRVHNRGGSILGTSRENPTEKPEKMANVVKCLKELNVTHLVTIGGDDTAHTSDEVSKANKDIHVVHVPKTIDNDLPLPEGIPTFGFETARHYGVDIVQNLMEDALTTQRWYLCVSMGRNAGHLALGIGKAAGVHLVLIPEEVNNNIRMETICDLIDATILKRQALGRPYGVVVMAEGMIEKINKADLEQIKDAPIDEHGHIRLAEVDVGKEVSHNLQKRFKNRKEKTTLVSKNIGYELRCAAPIPYDCEYTRDLGYAAMKFLLDGKSSAMISIQGGKAVPMPFANIIDSKTHKTIIRMVDIHTESYAVAREYQIRLEKADLAGEMLEKISNAAGMKKEDFVKQYSHIIQEDIRKPID